MALATVTVAVFESLADLNDFIHTDASLTSVINVAVYGRQFVLTYSTA